MAVNNTKIEIQEGELEVAARRYSRTLRSIPMIAMQDTLKYVTVVPGIQGDLVLSNIHAEAHWAPYRQNDDEQSKINLFPRTLTTRLSSLEISFDPNQVAAKLMEVRPNIGDGQAQTPLAARVLMEVQRTAGENMNAVLFSAKYNPVGKTEAACFDGWDTVGEKEIQKGTVSAAKGNYLDLGAYTLDQNNTFDAINYIYASCSPKLKGYANPNRPIFIFCSPDVQTYYNMGMKEYLGAIQYNKQWNQPTVLGSNGKAILVPIIAKADSQFIQVTPKSNILFGTDKLNDMNSYKVKVPKLWDVLAGGTMWSGCQFESIDKADLLIAKIGGVAAPINPFTGGNASSGGSNAETPGTSSDETSDAGLGS